MTVVVLWTHVVLMLFRGELSTATCLTATIHTSQTGGDLSASPTSKHHSNIMHKQNRKPTSRHCIAKLRHAHVITSEYLSLSLSLCLFRLLGMLPAERASAKNACAVREARLCMRLEFGSKRVYTLTLERCEEQMHAKLDHIPNVCSRFSV